MQFNLENSLYLYTIRAYGPGSITVAIPSATTHPDLPGSYAVHHQEVLCRSIVVSPEELIRDWPPQSFTELTATHMKTIVDIRPEVILIGTGARLQWPLISILEPLISAHIGYEVMDTAAACRTYNILAADGRRVAAALLII